MTARLVVAGTIAPRSQPRAMRVRGEVVTPTRTPIVEMCPCGREGCDCDEWPEVMHTAPFEDAAERKTFFTWSDETVGGHHNWSQSEEDWIRTGC